MPTLRSWSCCFSLELSAGRCWTASLFWGRPLHRALCTRQKCPRECYKQMFQLLVQASVCLPQVKASAAPRSEAEGEPATNAEGGPATNAEAKPDVLTRHPSNQHLAIESELRKLSRDSVELTVYLYAYLLRNGLHPTESMKTFMNGLSPIEWVEGYLSSPPSLRDLAVRAVRSRTYLSGNVMYGVQRLGLPSRIRNLILLCNPL